MATETVRYVNTDSTVGGDGTTNNTSGTDRAFPSIATWEAARQRNLVSADEQETVYCSAPSGVADTSQCKLLPASWTVDSTRFVRVAAAASDRAGSKFDTTKYRIQYGGFNGAFESEIGYTQLSGIQVDVQTDSDSYNGIIFDNAVGGHRVDGCYSRGPGVAGTNANKGFNFNGGQGTQSYAWNCIAEGWRGALNAIGFAQSSALVWFLNCTAITCNRGFYNADSGYQGEAYNCLSYNCDSNDFDQGYSWFNSDYNASSDGTAPGANSNTDATFSFVGGGDYALASDDAGARNQGDDDPGSLGYTDDINGETRVSPWDIGADEYVAAALSEPTFYKRYVAGFVN